MDGRLLQYQTDYLISWDFSSADCPCVGITMVGKDGQHLTAKSLGVSFEKTGCVSLIQMLNEVDRREREKAERDKDSRDRLRNAFTEEERA